jgi:hypothetical protein
MSEPRWNDADTREPRRQPARPAPAARPPSSGQVLGRPDEPRGKRPPARGAPVGAAPRWGQLPWVRGIVIVASAAGLGTLLTIITRSDPGFLLGVMIVAGTVAACLAVSPRRAYLIIPAPALAYLPASILSGLIHDRAADASRTLLTINAARWVADGFVTMAVATGLAALIAGARWLRAGRGSALGPPPARDGRRTPPSDRTSGQGAAMDQGSRRLPK